MEGNKEEAVMEGNKGQAVMEGNKGQAVMEGNKGQAVMEGKKGQAVMEGNKGQAVIEGKKGQAAVDKMEMPPPVLCKVPKKKGPKKMSGYQFFLRACIEEMKTQYPDSSIVLSVVSQLCSLNWQHMSEEIRQRFHQEADAVNRAKDQMDNSANSQVGTSASSEVSNSAANSKADTSAKSQVGNNANSEVGCSAKPKVGNSANSEVGNSANSEVGNSAKPKVGNSAKPKVGNSANSEVGNSVKSQAGVGMVKKEKRVYKKKPTPAFKLFCREHRLEVRRSHRGFSKDQIACLLSNMWMTTDDATKMKYEDLSRKQFERYLEEREQLAAMFAVRLTAKQEEEQKDTDEQAEEEKTIEDDQMQGLNLDEETSKQ